MQNKNIFLACIKIVCKQVFVDQLYDVGKHQSLRAKPNSNSLTLHTNLMGDTNKMTYNCQILDGYKKIVLPFYPRLQMMFKYFPLIYNIIHFSFLHISTKSYYCNAFQAR